MLDLLGATKTLFKRNEKKMLRILSSKQGNLKSRKAYFQKSIFIYFSLCICLKAVHFLNTLFHQKKKFDNSKLRLHYD